MCMNTSACPARTSGYPRSWTPCTNSAASTRCASCNSRARCGLAIQQILVVDLMIVNSLDEATASVAVLLRFRTFQHECHRGLVGHRAVTDASRDHEQAPGGELHGLVGLQLDAERPRPAQEQLVLVMVVPGELAVQAGDPDDGPVGP